MNTTKRQEYIYQIQEILATDLPNIPLYHKIGISGYNNDFYDFLKMPRMFAMISADSLKKVYYDETLSGEGKSPVRIAFIDSNERRTGWNPETGGFVTEIPNSSCLPDQNIVKIRSAIGNYTLEVYGTGNGTYNVETVSISSQYKYVDIQGATIQENQTRQYYITVHQDGSITVRTPSDGDNWIPEFPSFIIVPLFMIATLLTVIAYRRKHARY